MAVAGIVGAGAIAGLSIILASIFNNEQHPDNSVTITPLPKTITLYSINGATGIINETNKTIAVTVSFGTIVSNLIACFDTSTNCVVKVGVTSQASGVTSNSFTDPVTYRVIAADGTTADYIVTVTVAKSSSRAITSYSIKTPPATGIINEESEGNKTITVAVPYLTTVNDLIAIFTTTGSSVIANSTTQTSGTTRNDFTNNLTYTVIAADGSTANYTVNVKPSGINDRAITSYSILSATGAINETAETIGVTVPYNTTLNNLVATFSTTGTAVKIGSTLQVSGTTSNNFTSPLKYTVDSGGGTTGDKATFFL